MASAVRLSLKGRGGIYDKDCDWLRIEFLDRRRVPVFRYPGGKSAGNSRRLDRARDDAGLQFYGSGSDPKRQGCHHEKSVWRSNGAPDTGGALNRAGVERKQLPQVLDPTRRRMLPVYFPTRLGPAVTANGDLKHCATLGLGGTYSLELVLCLARSHSWERRTWGGAAERVGMGRMR